MTAVTDAELPSKVLYTVDTGGQKARLFDRIRDGGASADGTRPQLPEDRHLLYDDAVYQLSRDVTKRTPATSYSVKVDVVQGEADESETIRFADLPAVDRERFAEKGLASGETIGIGTGFLYTDAQRKRSVLVPESNYSVITWESGSRAEWVVDDASETTLYTYRYTAERITSAAEYGTQMRERFAFELSDLSADERAIVKKAVAESHYTVDSDETPPSAFLSVARRFRGQEHPSALGTDSKTERNGTYLIQFDGTVYWTVLLVRDDVMQTATRTT